MVEERRDLLDPPEERGSREAPAQSLQTRRPLFHRGVADIACVLDERDVAAHAAEVRVRGDAELIGGEPQSDPLHDAAEGGDRIADAALVEYEAARRLRAEMQHLPIGLQRTLGPSLEGFDVGLQISLAPPFLPPLDLGQEAMKRISQQQQEMAGEWRQRLLEDAQEVGGIGRIERRLLDDEHARSRRLRLRLGGQGSRRDRLGRNLVLARVPGLVDRDHLVMRVEDGGEHRRAGTGQPHHPDQPLDPRGAPYPVARGAQLGAFCAGQDKHTRRPVRGHAIGRARIERHARIPDARIPAELKQIPSERGGG